MLASLRGEETEEEESVFRDRASAASEEDPERDRAATEAEGEEGA